MTDFNEIMKQAQRMQEQFQQAQQDLVNLELTGESGAGLVSVILNGQYDVKNVSIDDSVLAESKDVVEDLIAAAFNDGVRKLEEKKKESLGAMAGGFNLPEGFKFPF